MWLGISERTVWDLIASGQIPVVRVGARALRIDETDLDAFIDERRERRGGAQ